MSSPQPPASAAELAARSRFAVVAVGNAIVDVLAHTDEAFLDDRGLVKGTMRLINADEAHGLYDAMGPAVEVSGGSAANTAAGIASFGGRVAFIGKVADDQLGEVFGHDLRAAGVHYATPAAASPPATARCLVLVTDDAQRTLNTFLGMSADIGPADIDESVVTDAAVVYCEGYLWDQPAAKAAILHAMDVARAAGRQVAFTLSDPFCVERHRPEFLDLVEGRVDVLFANESEICALYGTSDFDEAAATVAEVVHLACLTRSELGSVVVGTGVDGGLGRVEVPATPVAEVIDTTGAGDLYAAGFLHGYTTGRPLAECAALGSLAAAEVISHLGARPAVPLAALASRQA
jgi:sugar/nucleoside kinase (ribokinase family)